MDWISIKDRLPEEHGEVKIKVKKYSSVASDEFIVRYNPEFKRFTGCWFFYDLFIIIDCNKKNDFKSKQTYSLTIEITHWMPNE